MVPGSVCEEHIDDLSHFVTNKSRMQLFQDVARIGKAVKVGTAELGLTLSRKSTLLANDKSSGKLIVGHLETDGVPICLGAAATDLGIETAAVKRRSAAGQWKRIWKGRRRAKRVNRLCKMNSEAQKLTMTGIHPVQIYGHTAQGASHAQVNAMCRSLKLGTVLGKTQACSISTVSWFFIVECVPQTAARVEQISEWISMWRKCNVVTRRRIRKFLRKNAPMQASNPRRWNQATGPVRITVFSSAIVDVIVHCHTTGAFRVKVLKTIVLIIVWLGFDPFRPVYNHIGSGAGNPAIVTFVLDRDVGHHV